jgi:hypothetical protein
MAGVDPHPKKGKKKREIFEKFSQFFFNVLDFSGVSEAF